MRTFLSRLLNGALAAAAIFACGSVMAQTTPPAGPGDSKLKSAEQIVSQPAKDVGVQKVEIPAVLVSARENTYDLTGLKTCGQLREAVAELDQVLGPDFDVAEAKDEDRTTRLVEAGGRTVVNTLIPFRGVVRELSGAAPAERNLNLAISAGYARRGFLRGVQQKQGCRGAS